MALVGPITINGSTGNSNWAFKTVVTETEVEVTNKTSTIKVECFLGRTSSTSYFMGNYKLTIEVGSQKYSETLYKNSGNIAAGKYVSLGSHTFVVEHTTTPMSVKVKGSYSNAQFAPSSASSESLVTLSTLHESPLPDGDPIFEEQNSVLTSTGIGGNYFVPHLSIKKITVPAITYDDSTIVETRATNGPTNYVSSLSQSSVVTMDLTRNELHTTYEDLLGRTIVDLQFSITDSMGGTFKWVYPYTFVIPYFKPNLIPTASSIKRNGQISGKVNLNLTGTFYNGKIGNTNNIITVGYKYWKKGATEPTTYNNIPSDVVTISNNNVSINNWTVTKNGSVVTDVSKNSLYLFKIKLTDSFGETSEIELTCPKGEWLMARFKDRIDFKKITISGTDIIEKGTNANGSWVKYYDGTMICMQTLTLENVSVSTTWGNLYVYTDPSDNWHEFPQKFTELDHFSLDIGNMIEYNGFWLGDYGRKKIELDRWQGFCLVRPTSATVSAELNVLAIGKWK